MEKEKSEKSEIAEIAKAEKGTSRSISRMNKLAVKESAAEIAELENNLIFLKKNWENREIFLSLGGASQLDITSLEKNIKKTENRISELKK